MTETQQFYNDEVIKEILIREGYVTLDEMNKAATYSKANQVSLTVYLLNKEIITKDLLGQAIAEAYGVEYADLNSNFPSREQVFKIRADDAQKLRAILFEEKKDIVIIATDNPARPNLRMDLDKLFAPRKVQIKYSLSEDIEEVLINYRTTLTTRFQKIIESQKKIAPGIVDEIIEDALLYRASDVHFEPHAGDVVIRFRVDGVLHEAGRVTPEHYESILNRIKVLSKLRIDEKFATQDGAIRFSKNGKNADLRVSIAPTLDGEKVVFRVLAEYVHGFAFSDLGLSEVHQKLIEDAAAKPFGMVLTTGPTGSGKTTTLYAILKTLNKPDVNITTIEDPVEFKIAGINQIQVNNGKNITFANGLRSIVRQDPDTILVGEIRDKETAEISVNAALTGHLLFSTFHANDAATSIPRLIDMGVEPFLLSSTLQVIIAQRLARKICESCRYSESISIENLVSKVPQIRNYFSASIGEKDIITLYKGKGCNVCNNTGYSGRTGIFEFIKITPDLQKLILKNPSTREIWEVARREGSKSLFEDGIEKVKNGITSLEELLRVAEPPE
ncbi:MAG: ATPase, T2SS/T4P/T4SS family [bacterium]|nr:ATPase, T2SS/T4P/T4SS family [bacterium]